MPSVDVVPLDPYRAEDPARDAGLILSPLMATILAVLVLGGFFLAFLAGFLLGFFVFSPRAEAAGRSPAGLGILCPAAGLTPTPRT